MISRASKRDLANMRRGPLVVQDGLSTAGLEVAPDAIALECCQRLCGVLAGTGFEVHGVTMDGVTVDAVALTIQRRTGSQWVFVPRSIAVSCSDLVGKAVRVRRRSNGRYDVKRHRPREKDSKIARSQVIVDWYAQLEEVARALHVHSTDDV